MTTAPERAFTVFRRGVVRDEIMASWRFRLRQVTNPDTNMPFTETEIAVATARLSRWYIEADAIDLVLLAHQARDLYFADQARIDRASTEFLENYHGRQWGAAKLPGVGGSGPVDAPATPGTVFVGSTTVPDPAAHYGRDEVSGLRFQVLFTTTATANGIAGGTADGAELQVQGVDTGSDTNLDVGRTIAWSNGPPGAPEAATVTTKLSGGHADETDREFARRLLDRVRRKEGAGNSAQFRSWARQANVSVEDAFIYACAIHAGSVRVVVTQKRGDTEGPAGRIASVGTLADVTAYLTPPASPVVPTPPLVVVTAAVGEDADTTLGMAMATGQSSGWTDVDPFPGIGTGAPYYTAINALTDQQNFQITRGSGSKDLPAGVTAPELMAWDDATSRFEELQVQSVTLNGGDVYDVVLSAAPTITLAVDTRISPDAGQRLLIAQAIEDYFDSLGPGELVDLTTDERAHRAFRYPVPTEEYPQRAGSLIISRLQDSLGAALADGTQPELTTTTPTVAADPYDEPNLIVPNHVGIYPLE